MRSEEREERVERGRECEESEEVKEERIAEEEIDLLFARSEAASLIMSMVDLEIWRESNNGYQDDH